MRISLTRGQVSTVGIAAAGPAAIGAVLGMPRGGAAMASGAAMLPGVVLGVTALMVPALYIATSLLGAAPPAKETPAHLGRALRAMGTVLLGLAAPAAFLVATTARGTGREGLSSAATALVLGGVVTAFGTFVGLRRLFQGLFGGRPTGATAMVVCAVWSIVALVIGGRLFLVTLGGAA